MRMAAEVLRGAVLLCGMLMVGNGWAQTGEATAKGIREPVDERVVLRLHGEGVQIYACEMTDGAAGWVFKAPEATLLDASGKEVGRHGAGPTWSYKDGSSVGGEVESKTASPEAGAIPWLMLRAIKPKGTGVLSGVTHVARIQTHGGMPPPSVCGGGHVGETKRVEYTATYVFYGAR